LKVDVYSFQKRRFSHAFIPSETDPNGLLAAREKTYGKFTYWKTIDIKPGEHFTAIGFDELETAFKKDGFLIQESQVITKENPEGP